MSSTRREFLVRSAVAFATGGIAAPWAAAQAPADTKLVAAVRDLGIQFRDNPVNITGQDVAASIPLDAQRSLWIFGDTVEGEFATIRNHDLTNVLSSTAAFVPQQDVSSGIKNFAYLTDDHGRPRQLIRFEEDEDKSRHRLWPVHGIRIDQQVYLFYHKITMDPEVDVFENFALNGMGIARGKVGEFQFERLRAPDGTREFWKGDQPGFGVWADLNADGFLYLWGSFWTGMFLARVRPAAIEDFGSYEYLVECPTRKQPETKARWSREFQPTAVLFDSVPNEMSASYNSYLEEYVAIHVHNRDNKLALRTAPAPWGPWSDEETFFMPELIKPDDLFTAAKEHPDLRRANGKIMYVTYVNSSFYMPHMLELTLK